MENTGKKIITYKDTNPYSPTYNTTRQETVVDLDTCPNEVANWVEQSRSCEQIAYSPSGEMGNSGKSIITEKDTNPNSSSYNETRTRTVNDLINCPLPNTGATWTEESSVCEQE